MIWQNQSRHAALLVAGLLLSSAGVAVGQQAESSVAVAEDPPAVVAAEDPSSASVAEEPSAVVDIAKAADLLQLTVGYSLLLQADEPFETIIMGDDTVAIATVGAGNSIILTGLAAGSTNLIVLGESQRVLLSSTVDVSPVNGPLRSTVTVLKGATAREQYECRGNDCRVIVP